MPILELAALVLLIALTGVFTGGETGLYSLSRLRVEAEARAGHRSARIIRRLLRDDAGLLATVLIGYNLMVELSTYAGARLLERLGLAGSQRELVLALVLTPIVFLFAEFLPKDLFLRRPHTLLGYSAPLIAAAKILFLPLAWPLRVASGVFERALGLESHELARVHGREAVIELLQESEAPVLPHTERMARNALELRSLRVERVMVPWRAVETLHVEGDPRAALARTPYTRLPVVDRSGAVLGYVHQLEVLASEGADGVARHLRPMIALEPSTPIDRALARLRATGQRAALVGPSARPLGLVTLKDLVEEISGELARW